MSRIYDIAFFAALLALAIVAVCRISYVLGPDACWTSCT